MISDFRVLIVAAVSSERQAADDRGSLEAQLTECRAACARNDWHVVKEIVLPGQSRSYFWLHQIVADSPEYAEIVQSVESHLINLIVCWRYDRLWRGYLQGQVQALCAQHGVQIYSTQEPILPKPPSEKEHASETEIIQMLSGWQARREVRTMQERRRIGIAKRIRDGKTGSYTNPPYGYRLDENHDSLIVVPTEASWVRRMYALRAENAGFLQIRRELAACGVPPPSASPFRHYDLCQVGWSHATIRGILSNPVYIGAVSWGPYYNEKGLHEVIVEPDLWYRVQEINKLRQNAFVRQNTENQNPLAGIARCGYCGHAMGIHSSSRRSPLLRCSHYSSTGGHHCQSNSVLLSRVIEQLSKIAKEVIERPDLFAQLRKKHSDDGQPDGLEQVSAALTDLRQRFDRLYMAFETGAVTLDHFQQRASELRAQIGALEAQDRQLQEEVMRGDYAMAQFPELRDIVDKLPDLPVDDQRRVFSALMRQVHIRGHEIEIDWW